MTDRLLTDIHRLQVAYKAWRTTKPNIGERTRVRKALGDLTQLVTEG